MPQCTKPTIHYLRPTILVTPDSREFFGCRINGIPFSPQAEDSVSLGNCRYVPAYGVDEGWKFEINGNRFEPVCGFFMVGITLDSVLLEKWETYMLGSPGSKKNYGTYMLIKECSQNSVQLYTSDDMPGEVTITKIDHAKKIVTGTFDFKVKDASGFLYRMSDGVFDRHFGN